MNNSDRSLTDADIEAIVDAVINKAYSMVGKGVMKFVWAGVFSMLITLAYIGMKK